MLWKKGSPMVLSALVFCRPQGAAELRRPRIGRFTVWGFRHVSGQPYHATRTVSPDARILGPYACDIDKVEITSSLL